MKQLNGNFIEMGKQRRADRPTSPVGATTQTNDDGMVNSQPVKRRSWVWDYCLEIKDANGKRCGGKCNGCGKSYKLSVKNGTSPLINHLKTCQKKRNGDGEEHPQMTAITNPVVGRETMIVEHRSPVRRQSRDYEDLLENLVNYIPQLQEGGDLRPVIFPNYNEEKASLHKTLSFDRCSISINLLRCGTVDMYFCLALQYIDVTWKSQKKVVAFKTDRVFGSYIELSEVFINLLLDWDFQKNVCCITAENNEEADKIVSEIRKWLVDQDLLPLGGKISHVNCFLHFLNHLIEVGLQEVHDIMCKIVNCVDYVCNTPAEYDDDDLRNAVEYVRSEVKKMTSEDMAVSWKVDLPMLERLLSLNNAFHEFKKFDSKFNESNPTVVEWETATLILKFLEHLDKIVRSFTGSSCLTTNLYFPIVCNTYWELHERTKHENSGFQSMASKMKTKFDKYWDTSGVSLAIAVILDPRFKFNIVQEWFIHLFGIDVVNQCAKIWNILEEVYNEYAGGSKNSASSSCDASSSMSNVAYYCDIMLGSLGLPLKPNDVEDGWLKRSELQRYLDEPTITRLKDVDVLPWWRDHEPYFPVLAKMARDFLAIPMSAALSNPSFKPPFAWILRSWNI